MLRPLGLRHHRRLSQILLFAAVIVPLIVVLLMNRSGKQPQHLDEVANEKAILRNDDSKDDPMKIRPGDGLLSGYATVQTEPEEDMRKLSHAVEGMLLLFKNLDTRFIARNQQLAAFLKGENSEKLEYLSSDSPALNNDGLLIDRWNFPIIIHPLGTGLLELRSSGPDGIPYNEDDLAIHPDGRILRGYESE